MSVQYRCKDGEALDWIVWQFYGRQDQGLTEAVLAANPGLAALPPLLPAGTVIVLPDISTPTASAAVKLWD